MIVRTRKNDQGLSSHEWLVQSDGPADGVEQPVHEAVLGVEDPAPHDGRGQRRHRPGEQQAHRDDDPPGAAQSGHQHGHKHAEEHVQRRENDHEREASDQDGREVGLREQIDVVLEPDEVRRRAEHLVLHGVVGERLDHHEDGRPADHHAEDDQRRAEQGPGAACLATGAGLLAGGRATIAAPGARGRSVDDCGGCHGDSCLRGCARARETVLCGMRGKERIGLRVNRRRCMDGTS